MCDRKKGGEAVCVSGPVCVYAGGKLCIQMSFTFTEIMLFSALLRLNMPKNFNSASFEE